MNATNTTESGLPLAAVIGVGVPDSTISVSIVILRIIVLILCIIWRNEPPLKIRWPIPIITNLCFLVFYDTSKFLSSWAYSGAWPDVAQGVRTMLIWPGLVLVAIAFSHHYVRYYVLGYLDSAKVSEKNVQNLQYFKALVSTKTMVAVLCIAALILYPFSILFATLGVIYSSLYSSFFIVVMIVNIVVGIAIALLCVVIFINDFMRNIRKGIRVYFVEDPFLFRIEGVVSVAALMTLVILAVLFLLPKRAVSASDALFISYWVASRIVTLIAELLYCVLSGLICVIAILLVKLRPSQSAIENETELQKLLRVGGKGRKLFEAYIKSEFSSENMLCYNDTIKFRDKKSQEELTLLVHQLYEKYVKQGTLSEVSLPDFVRTEYNLVIGNPSASMEQMVKLLESLERETLVNLGDSFMRFKFTPTYKKLIGQE